MSFGIENLNALLSKNENAEGTEHEILKKDVNNCKTAVTLVLTEVLKSVSGKVSSSSNGSTPRMATSSKAAVVGDDVINVNIAGSSPSSATC